MISLKDVQQLALIGAKLKLCTSNGEEVGTLMAVNYETLRIQRENDEIDISIGAVKQLSVLAAAPDEKAFKRLAARYRELIGYAKTRPIKLCRFFEKTSLESLISQLEGSTLQPIFEDQGFLSGNIPAGTRIEKLLQELDRAELGKDERDLAHALLYTAFRQMNRAMQVWLRHHQAAGRLDDAFVRCYGMPLAITATACNSRNASFTVAASVQEANPGKNVPQKVTLDRMPIFMFWASQLLRVDPIQLLENKDVWVRYLLQCVVFNSFGALKEHFAHCTDEAFVYAALRDLFVLMDEYTWAWQAEQQTVPIARLLLHLPDQRITYGVRLARCAELLIEQNLLGKSDVGYIFEFNRGNGWGIIVSGCLHELRFKVEHQNGLAALCSKMAEQYTARLDYDPVLLRIGEDGKINPLEEGDAQE